MGEIMSYNKLPEKGFLGPTPTKVINQYMLTDDRVDEIHNVAVHTFRMGDVEDPALYAAQPLWEWEKSDAGKWVMEHAVETPAWYQQMTPYDLHYVFVIRAKLKAKDYSYFLLKWGKEGTQGK
jgi:hypothetical protein